MRSRELARAKFVIQNAMSSASLNSSPVSIHQAYPEKDESHTLDLIGRIVTSGDQQEYVHLGGQRYLRSELAHAFGGTFTTGVGVQSNLKIGNASPVGLLGFFATTAMLSLINARARGLSNTNIMVGSAMFYGGAVQIFAGFWELAVRNTFAGTVFASYGGYWMSFSVISMGGFNIEASYKSTKDFENAMGIFMLVWSILSFMFTLCTIRSTVPMFCMLLSTTLSYTLSAASFFAHATGSDTAGSRCSQAGGIFGCLLSFFALYNAMAGLLTRENSYMEIKPWYMPGAIRPDDEHTEV